MFYSNESRTDPIKHKFTYTKKYLRKFSQNLKNTHWYWYSLCHKSFITVTLGNNTINFFCHNIGQNGQKFCYTEVRPIIGVNHAK